MYPSEGAGRETDMLYNGQTNSDGFRKVIDILKLNILPTHHKHDFIDCSGILISQSPRYSNQSSYISVLFSYFVILSNASLYN